MKKEVKPGELNEVEQAQAVIKAEKQKRAEQCGKEIDVICEKYNCRLVPSAEVIVNGQMLSVVINAN